MPTIAPKVPDRSQKPHIIVNNRLPPARPPMTEKPAVPSSATPSPRTPTKPQQETAMVYMDIIRKSKSPVQKVETPDTTYTTVDSTKTKEISDL